ncbi:PHP domain-containing protein [Halobiforma nitratireducens JCM 10879]|uniref:PHP domain-containing protein n=1 Tax=Halobiforma nitratireducens JCM 10879 TaxID=1227454 RepID=M0M2V2_9EURY|nr:PHP domain-containing protein [Halobiforma nitratireducens JCM 10879]
MGASKQLRSSERTRPTLFETLRSRTQRTKRTEALFISRGKRRHVLSVELHVHSSLSYDGRDSVELILEQAEAVDLDAIAVTDHDEIDASLEAAERASEYGLVGIPGIEISTKAGHVLGLGVDEAIPPGLSYETTIERIRDQGGLAVIPHPFQESRHGVMGRISREELAKGDAIEVYNSRLLTGRANRQAERFAKSRNLPMTAGSDAHISEMVGQAITRVDADERSAEAILEAIRRGKTSVEGKRTPWHISVRQFAGGVTRRVRSGLLGLMGPGSP